MYLRLFQSDFPNKNSGLKLVPTDIGKRKTLYIRVFLSHVDNSNTACLRFPVRNWQRKCTNEVVSKCSRNQNIIYLFTAIRLLPGGSGYFTCKQNMKLVTTRFKLGGLHEKHVVVTSNLGNRLSICL